MFYRNSIKELEKWSQSRDRKPLIIRGARQVGKTTLVQLFSKQFDHFIHLNLEFHENREIFESNKSVNEVVNTIFFLKNIPPKNKKILIFIDEIQNSPEAVSLMRYFYEEKKELYIIGAGSLLETKLSNKEISFPVGRVQYLFLYPMVFEEFLLGFDEEQAFNAYNTIPVPKYANDKLFNLFHTYTLLGGMPEILKRYKDNNLINELTPYYQGLILSYIDDTAKYSKNTLLSQVSRHAIETAPLEAGKRIKFHKFGNSEYRSREVGEALRNIERAMVIQLLYPSTSVKLPIVPDMSKSPRLQFVDTGLVNFISGFQDFFFKNIDIESLYQGIILEHCVGQEFTAIFPYKPGGLTFWVREEKQSNAEVDFIIPYKGYIIPVEVKSGKSGKLRSLHQFIDRTNHDFAIRLYYGTLSIENTQTIAGKKFRLLNLPYYLSGKIFNYLDYYFKK